VKALKGITLFFVVALAISIPILLSLLKTVWWNEPSAQIVWKIVWFFVAPLLIIASVVVINNKNTHGK
jgi:hypothetical protein